MIQFLTSRLRLENNIKEYTSNFNKLVSNEDRLRKGILKLRKKIKQATDELTEQKVLKQQAKQLLQWQNQLKVDIRELNSDDFDLDNIIVDYLKKVKEIINNKKQLK